MITKTLNPADLNAMSTSPWTPTQRESGSYVFKNDMAFQYHNDWISTVTHIFVLYTRWLEEDMPGDKKHELDMEILRLVSYLMAKVPVANQSEQFYTHLNSAIRPWYRNLIQ